MYTHLRPQQGVQEAVLDLTLLGIIPAHGSRGEREEGGGKMAVRRDQSFIHAAAAGARRRRWWEGGVLDILERYALNLPLWGIIPARPRPVANTPPSQFPPT